MVEAVQNQSWSITAILHTDDKRPILLHTILCNTEKRTKHTGYDINQHSYMYFPFNFFYKGLNFICNRKVSEVHEVKHSFSFLRLKLNWIQ